MIEARSFFHVLMCILVVGFYIFAWPITLHIRKLKDDERKRQRHVGKQVVEVQYDEYRPYDTYIQETNIKLKKGDKIKVRWPNAKYFTDIYSAKVIKENYIIDSEKSLEIADKVYTINPIEIIEINGKPIKEIKNKKEDNEANK